MKKVLLGITVIIAAFITFTTNTQDVHGNRSGAPAGRTGSPGDGNQNCTNGCHSGTAISNSVNAAITSSIPATGYVPGQTYTVTGTVSGTSLVRFGYELSPQTVAGVKVGNLAVTDGTNTQILTAGKYITHTNTGSSGSGSRTWTCNWVAPTAGTGGFTFYGAFNAANNNNSNGGDIIYLENLPITEAAQINTHPTNQNACSGANASFNISATGTSIAYQWKKNGSVLSNDGHFSGVTTNTLTITGVIGTDVDSYTCEVTGSGNTVASNAATLTLLTPASISDGPDALTICAGQPASFSITAAGTNISYQWKRNGVNVTNGGTISGATTNTLSISSVVAGNAGTYTCQVSNTCTTPTSAGALLTVNPTTAINTQPATTTTLCIGNNLSLSVAAEGTNLHYQWKRGNTNVGTDQASFSVNGVTTGDAGNYTVVITGDCGNATSSIAAVTVNTTTAINTQPATPTTLCEGSTLNLSVSAVGTNLSYQWKRGNTNVGTNSPNLSISNVTTTDAGTYTVTITGACGTVISGNSIVSINPATAIDTQPVSQSGCNNSNVTFTVDADGINLSYQWKKGITPVGTNSSNLTLNNISAGDAGNYTVEVTGSCGPTVISNIAVLTVVSNASISQQPTAQQICFGQPLILNVIGNGGNNTTYQWRKGGNNVGTNSSTYNIPVSSVNDLGNYDVVITGSCGTVTSQLVAVTAIDATVINNIATSQQLCIGEPLTLGVIANGQNLSYQWLHQGSPINNETGTTLVINSLVAGDAGLYSVTVTGDCGTVTGTISTVALLTPPAITGLGQPLDVCAGNAIFMGVQATGDNIAYHWQKNGVEIPNANQSGYTEIPANGDVFTVLVSNVCDTVSHSFTAVVNPLPVPVAQQISNTTLTVTTTFQSYQWLDANGQPIPNATGIFFNPPSEGFYSVIVGDGVGCSDTSQVIMFIIGAVGENTLPGVSLYPNPTNGDVYFTTPANMANFNIKIINATGQLVMDKIVESNYINIAQIPSGLYTAIVTHKGRVARIRLARN